MKKFLFLSAVFCLLASANQVNAQLIIRNNGYAEIGHDPYDPVPSGLPSNYYNCLDTVTTFKVFGNRGSSAAGGHITFGDNLLQNQYNYIIASDVLIGRAVDANRTYGNVTIKQGIEYEIESSGSITLMDGFSVENGATFAVYPSCF